MVSIRWLPEIGSHGVTFHDPVEIFKGDLHFGDPLSAYGRMKHPVMKIQGDANLAPPSYITVNISFTVSSCYISFIEMVSELFYVLFTRPKFMRVDVLSKKYFLKVRVFY